MSCEFFPSLDRQVHVGGVQLHGVAAAAGDLSGDDGGALAGEGLVYRLAGAGVVLDGSLHALHRFLGAVGGLDVLARGGDVSDRDQLAAAVPVGLALDRVPAGLVHPVVVAAREHQPLFNPNDLGADGKAAGIQAGRDRGRMQGAEPDVGHLAGKERPDLPPIGAVLVQYRESAALRTASSTVSPYQLKPFTLTPCSFSALLDNNASTNRTRDLGDCKTPLEDRRG